jgi:hypothetical protein
LRIRFPAIRPRGNGDNEISLLLPNRSRIIGLPGDGDTTRGYSNVELLVIEEASRVSDRFYNSLRPVIATNERAAIWLMSTPNGRQGFFYDEWIRPGSNWTRIEAQPPAVRASLPSTWKKSVATSPIRTSAPNTSANSSPLTSRTLTPKP